MVDKPKKRMGCEFCERKFGDQDSLDRHVRALHRKTAKLVKALREALSPIANHAEALDRFDGEALSDGYVVSEAPQHNLTLGHCRQANRVLFETGPFAKKGL